MYSVSHGKHLQGALDRIYLIVSYSNLTEQAKERRDLLAPITKKGRDVARDDCSSLLFLSSSTNGGGLFYPTAYRLSHWTEAMPLVPPGSFLHSQTGKG